jgi:hypothetical protein
LCLSRIALTSPQVLINNAGSVTESYVETADGFESCFGTYLGQFLFTKLIFPRILAGHDKRLSM